MKGVVLAGGRGTRLYPLTKDTNKHLLPVGREPMIFHSVKQLLAAGINEILIITGNGLKEEFKKVFAENNFCGADIFFIEQDKAWGIAHAVLLSEAFIGREPFLVYLGDNILTYSIKPFVQKYSQQKKGAKVLLKWVDDPKRFGVAFLKGDRLLEIQEKPLIARSMYAVSGIYMYDSKVFQMIREIGYENEINEWCITPVNNKYIAREEMTYEVIKGPWIDAGTIESYNEANKLLFNTNNKIING